LDEKLFYIVDKSFNFKGSTKEEIKREAHNNGIIYTYMLFQTAFNKGIININDNLLIY